jgi:hypothetical protein
MELQNLELVVRELHKKDKSRLREFRFSTDQNPNILPENLKDGPREMPAGMMWYLLNGINSRYSAVFFAKFF